MRSPSAASCPSASRTLRLGRRLAAAMASLAGALVVMATGAAAQAQPGSAASSENSVPTVLYIATERLSEIAVGYRDQPNLARLGFGTEREPWHVWYGGAEVQALIHLPGYRPGTPVRPTAEMLIGNRFAGKRWPDAFAALASFDLDGNGVVEGDELRDLYVWFDIEGDGQIANRDDAIRPAGVHYGGFDLRGGVRRKAGVAREGRMAAFSVIAPRTSRIHLLELPIDRLYASRREALVARSRAAGLAPSMASAPSTTPVATGRATSAAVAPHPLEGIWRWKITNAEQWKDPTRPWGAEASGQLMLAVNGDRIEGQVQMVGPYADRINLPLAGRWHDGQAQWTSVSPLGLTRSDVRLESFYGHPVLRGRAWSNRSGRITEWTWEARRERPLD